jgi:hypothetical protein
MLWKPDIIVDILLLPADAGGRQGPILCGNWHSCQVRFEDELFDCRIDMTESCSIYPGANGCAPIKFLRPDLILPRLSIGSEFDLCEGKPIGHAVIMNLSS